MADTAPSNALPLTSPLANPVFKTQRGAGKGVRVYLNKLNQQEHRQKNNSSVNAQPNLIRKHPTMYH